MWSNYIAFASRLVYQNASKIAFKLASHRQFLYTSAVGSSLATSFFVSNLKAEPKKKETNIELMMKIQEADSFYSYYMIDNAYASLRRYRNSNDPEVLWRLARIICEQGKMSKNPEEKKRLFEEALEFAERALAGEGGSSSFGSNKWYAIILNYASECQGTKAQLTKSLDIKAHLERALEIEPLDPTTWMILGMWHFAFADMSTVTRWAAKAIYATPPSSTYEEALRHFERAEAIQPGFSSMNTFNIAQVYERLGEKEKAIENYTKAFKNPILSVDDNKTHEQAHEKLKKFGIQSKDLADAPSKIVR